MGAEFVTPPGELPEESEARLLEIIGSLLSEASARYERFRAECFQHGTEGYTKEQLSGFLADAERFDAEFTKYEPVAQKLAEAGRPAAQSQLAAIQHDLQRSIAEVQDAYHLREAFESSFAQTAMHLPETRLPAGPPGERSSELSEAELLLLGRIEETYAEFCRAGQAFGALCAQYSYGPPSTILEGHWQQLEEMESRFKELEGEANRLAADNRSSAKQRLAIVEEDLLGTIAIVRKMHAARSGADSRAAELEAHAAHGLAESIQQMNKALGKSRGAKS